MWEVKSERDSRIAELEDEVNELHHLLTEREQAAEIASRDSRENQDSKQLLEETIRQLTYSLEKVAICIARHKLLYNKHAHAYRVAKQHL